MDHEASIRDDLLAEGFDYLRPEGRGVQDDFGQSVAVRGDRAVIGAPRFRNPAFEYVGAVYLAQRASDGSQTWGDMVLLLASDGGRYRVPSYRIMRPL